MLGRLSLKTILIGGALVTAVVPAAVLGIGSTRAVRESAITEAVNRSELLAAHVAGRDAGRVARYVGMLGDERLAGFATVSSVGWKVWADDARA